MRELWLFTMRYPFGEGEVFLENEMPLLCSRFDRVLVFPDITLPTRRTMPANAELCLVATDAHRRAGTRLALRNPGLAAKLLRSLRTDAPGLAAFVARMPELLSRTGQFIHRMQELERAVMPGYDPGHVRVLSYWWHDAATVLGLLKERYPALRFASRAHGFDLFEEQDRAGWIPFRQFLLEHTDKVFCVSRFGMEHLRQRHPMYADRFELFRLGTPGHGIAPHDPQGPLQLVSCAFVVPRKRVELIAEALALVRTPVQWTHFGGPFEEEGDKRLRELVDALPAHVAADLRGSRPNAEVIAHYRSRSNDAFLHMSRLEGGVPVAAQEAASFGIPLIAADSGGVRELVGPGTGRLLGRDPSARELAQVIDGLRTGPMIDAEFRSGVRRFWELNFRDTVNFSRFHDRLIGSVAEGHDRGGSTGPLEHVP